MVNTTVKEPEQETLEFDGCHMWILRKSGKVVIGIEQPKPEALIMIVGLIHILGEPESFTHEEGDNFVLFCFKDKSVENTVTEAWRKAFKVPIPSTDTHLEIKTDRTRGDKG